MLPTFEAILLSATLGFNSVATPLTPVSAETLAGKESTDTTLVFTRETLPAIPGSEVERLLIEVEKRKKRALREFTAIATAYTSSVDETDSNPFITASGSRTHPGTIAANFLPFGTKVKIPSHFGDRIFTVEDRMHKRFSDRVDIWMETKKEAFAFGKRRVSVVVVEIPTAYRVN